MATADSPTNSLQNAMRMAKVAIQLDGGDRHKEAYCEYLRTINYISHALLEEAGSQVLEEKETVPTEVERMLRLAEQCLERAKSFIGKTRDLTDLSATAYASSSCSSGQSEAYQNTVFQTATTVNTDDTGSSPFLPPEVFQRLQTVESQDGCKKELTPIEKASRLNQKLRASYEARLARLSPGQAYQKTSLTLSLQRQMMENLIVAKARQDALQRKMEERRLRLQEEANRRFAASGEMTVEEQEQRTLYASVLEYEQDHDWPKAWKANIKKNPNDVTLVSDLVSYLLSRSDHPVVKLLRKRQYQVYNKLYPIISRGTQQSSALTLPWNTLSPIHLANDLTTNYDNKEQDKLHSQVTVARENSFEDLEQFLTHLDSATPDSSSTYHKNSDYSELTNNPSALPDLDEGHISDIEMTTLKKHLQDIIKDIQIATDQLLSLCLLSFECLNIASSKYLCLTTIEEAFFMPLWNALMALFRKVNKNRELAFETSMKLYQDASPGDLGVPLKLFPPDLSESLPYECAVQELKLLTKESCPQRKLECIVRTSRLICACAEDYRSIHEVDSTPTTAAIGADDLLPILSFVVLHCQSPQLVSECAALEEFIHEGYLIGEEGYCLTSMQSALAYVETLHKGGT